VSEPPSQGWFGSRPDPGVESVEQRAQVGPIITGVVQIIGGATRRRIARRAVLRAAEGIDAHVGGHDRIRLAQGVGMNQRAAAVPVLGRALRVHHFRVESLVWIVAQNRAALLRAGIRGGAIGEGEVVDGIAVVLGAVPRSASAGRSGG
jgi:hypothetical protein